VLGNIVQTDTLLYVFFMQQHCSGWPLFWKTWKSRGIEKWSGKSQGKWIITIIQLPRVLFRQKYGSVVLLYTYLCYPTGVYWRM